MNRRAVLLGVGAIILVGAAVAVFGVNPPVEERYVLEGRVNESGKNLTIGIASGTEPIQFGVLPPEGASSERTVAIGNAGGKAVRLSFQVSGNISRYIHVTPSDGIRLPPEGQTNITLTFRPENAAAGYYRGTLTVRRGSEG